MLGIQIFLLKIRPIKHKLFRFVYWNKIISFRILILCPAFRCRMYGHVQCPFPYCVVLYLI